MGIRGNRRATYIDLLRLLFETALDHENSLHLYRNRPSYLLGLFLSDFGLHPGQIHRLGDRGRVRPFSRPFRATRDYFGIDVAMIASKNDTRTQK